MSTTSLNWRKSSYSGGDGGNCVEIAVTEKTVHVRDSKDKAGPTLAFSAETWTAFVNYARVHNI